MFWVVQPGQFSDVKCEIFPGISQPHAALVVKYISLVKNVIKMELAKF